MVNVSSNYVYGNCRDGFNHFGRLYINDKLVCESKCHYINRTWEAYAGQSARKSACYQWMQSFTEKTKQEVKANLGLKRMTATAKTMVEKRLMADETYQAVKKHYESL